jgi:penicillin-binding protein 2
VREAYSFKMRTTAFIVAVLFVISLFIADLFRIQVIDADEYSSQNIYYSSANTQIKAIRGEILDSTGKALVYSTQSNAVYIDASYFPSASKQEERNKIMLSLLKLFKKNGIEYNYADFIVIEDGEMKYTDGIASLKNKLFAKDYLNLNTYATAQNCFDALCDYYDLQDFSKEEALMLATVYVAMVNADFSKYNPYTIAENVPTDLVALIKEQSRFYKGVEVRVDTNREYYDGEIAPHIIGYYDYLNADEYSAVTEEYKESLKNDSLTEKEKEALNLRSYKMTDKIGKFGIESALEDQLRGTRGIATTTTNADGTKNTTVTTKPVNGNNVILTIDGDFQKKVQNILASKINSTKEIQNISAAGSIVVMDVNDFSILACASYPTYNLTTYKENIIELNNDKSAPLWNRALRSTYAPGSTMKPIMGFAGLEENIVTANTGILCTHRYDYFKDMNFWCFNVNNHAGQEINLETGLKHSCNIYFYEIGRQLGIDKMGEYFKKFGLGSKTGVELTESAGVVPSIAYRESLGGTWYPGDTVQAAIGQTDHLYTPIQLCSYAATLANGGTRYKAHFVESIKSADYSKTLYQAKPEVLSEVGGSKASYDAVKKGMIAMANTYTSLREADYQVAGKTGTADAKKRVNGVVVEYTNGFFISYAPAENPEIAVVIAIENVKSAGLPNYVKEVYDAYFNRNSDITASQQSGTILK